LVEPGRVHRRVYADPDVFELEMERIFGRVWLFVGRARLPIPATISPPSSGASRWC